MNAFEKPNTTPGPEENRGERNASGMANMLGKSALSREPLGVPVDAAEADPAHDPRIETFVHPASQVEIHAVDTQPGELPYVVPPERDGPL